MEDIEIRYISLKIQVTTYLPIEFYFTRTNAFPIYAENELITYPAYRITNNVERHRHLLRQN